MLSSPFTIQLIPLKSVYYIIYTIRAGAVSTDVVRHKCAHMYSRNLTFYINPLRTRHNLGLLNVLVHLIVLLEYISLWVAEQI